MGTGGPFEMLSVKPSCRGKKLPQHVQTLTPNLSVRGRRRLQQSKSLGLVMRGEKRTAGVRGFQRQGPGIPVWVIALGAP